MSDINAQLKEALISAIKEKQIKILEENKVLLEIIEGGINSNIVYVTNNTEPLENLEDPCPINTQVNVLEKIKENNFLCALLDQAINDFVVNRFAGKPQDFQSFVNPVNNPFNRPVFMQPGFHHPGFNYPGFPQSGFQQPGFQNQPPGFYPNIFGFGQNTNGFQQPFSSVSKNFPNESEDEQVSSNKTYNTETSFKNLLSELKLLYQKAVDQETGDELLSELKSVVEGFEKLPHDPNLSRSVLIGLRNQLREVSENIKNGEYPEPWNDLEVIDTTIGSILSDINSILDGYKKP